MKPFGLGKIPFGLSQPFDKLRMIGTTPFGLSLSKPSRHWVGEPFDRLRANGGDWVQVVAATAFFRCTASAALVVPVAGSLSAPR